MNIFLCHQLSETIEIVSDAVFVLKQVFTLPANCYWISENPITCTHTHIIKLCIRHKQASEKKTIETKITQPLSLICMQLHRVLQMSKFSQPLHLPAQYAASVNFHRIAFLSFPHLPHGCMGDTATFRIRLHLLYTPQPVVAPV